jgi:hypothetical protein
MSEDRKILKEKADEIRKKSESKFDRIVTKVMIVYLIAVAIMAVGHYIYAKFWQ